MRCKQYAIIKPIKLPKRNPNRATGSIHWSVEKGNIQFGEEAKDCRVEKPAVQAKLDGLKQSLPEKGT